MKTEPFKICTTCSKPWNTLEDFLADPEIKLVGYQVHFEELEAGLFFFNHLYENCYTTLAIPVKEFAKLSSRPLFSLRGKQPVCCPELCVRQGALDPCPVACECAWVREVMQTIRNWKKKDD